MSRLLLLGRRLSVQPRRLPLLARAASAKAPTPRMRDGAAGAELFRTLAARRDARGIELSVDLIRGMVWPLGYLPVVDLPYVPWAASVVALPAARAWGRPARDVAPPHAFGCLVSQRSAAPSGSVLV